jgi:hypothetical protein
LLGAGLLLGVLLLSGGPWAHFERSDIWVLYHGRHLASHALPYWKLRIEYPVLLGWWMWATAWVPGRAGYLVANIFGLSAAAWATMFLLRRMRPATYQWWAALPLVAAFVFVNWDVFGILALVASWDAWTRKRPGWTGLWLAIGAATKLFPVIAWPFMAYGWWHARHRREAVRMTVVAVVGWLALNVPEMIGGWRNWTWFWRFNATRSASTDLWWLLRVNHLLGRAGIDGFSLILVLLATGWALWRIARGWSPQAATAAVMAIFFLVNKVFSPQYMLWIFTSAVLAEWPLSSLVLLTIGGWADWATHFAALHIPQDLAAGAIETARLAVAGVVGGVALRYLAIAVALWQGLGRQAVAIRETGPRRLHSSG